MNIAKTEFRQNGFWGEGIDCKEANRIWDYLQKFAELDNMADTKQGLNGTSLDVFWSAKFLEEFNQTLPAIQRKEALRTIDANNDGRTSILEVSLSLSFFIYYQHCYCHQKSSLLNITHSFFVPE